MDWTAYLPRDTRALAYPEGRRRFTLESPMRFALVYLRHHMTSPEGRISLSEAHVEWSNMARELMYPMRLREWRHALAAPRECAKSTWWFLFIPLWAAAHGHRQFIAAFADSATQAETHLLTFKQELDNNPLLRKDFPDLCTAARRGRGTSQADNRGLYIAESGFVFAAKGVDSKTLGLKIGQRRPDMLVLDDVESDEKSYSLAKAGARLGTLCDAILPLNERAAVVLTGTVTMAGSLVHQVVQTANGGEPPEWITDQKIRCHHYAPILPNDDGTERSIWPEKWPLEYLKSIQGTVSYAKNFANMPRARGGRYWSDNSFTYGRLPQTNIRLLSIDPHVSRSTNSDFTGITIVGYSTPHDSFEVIYSTETKVRGSQLRTLVLRLIAEHSVTAVLIETNQGGDLWTDAGNTLSHLPCKTLTVHQHESKEVRAARALEEYEMGRVVHRARFEKLELQMTAFPKVVHDDMVDSLSAAFIEIRKRAKVQPKPPLGTVTSTIG